MSPTSVARWGQQNCVACGRRSNFAVAPRSKFKAEVYEAHKFRVPQAGFCAKRKR
jgi:hypothetical protein